MESPKKIGDLKNLLREAIKLVRHHSCWASTNDGPCTCGADNFRRRVREALEDDKTDEISGSKP